VCCSVLQCVAVRCSVLQCERVYARMRDPSQWCVVMEREEEIEAIKSERVRE